MARGWIVATATCVVGLVALCFAESYACTIDSCVTLMEQGIKELRPQWGDAFRASFSSMVRQTLQEGSQIEHFPGKLEVIKEELPVLLVNLPETIPSAQERVIIEKVRWYIMAYLARKEYESEVAAIRQESIRQQIAELIHRMENTISESMPNVSKTVIIVESDRCLQRCLELAGRQLAPILKEPMTQEELGKLYDTWEQETRAQRAIDTTTLSISMLRSQLGSLCGAMLTTIWQDADYPDDLKKVIVESSDERRAANIQVDEELEAEARIQARYGTKLETIEHWGNVLQLLFTHEETTNQEKDILSH